MHPTRSGVSSCWRGVTASHPPGEGGETPPLKVSNPARPRPPSRGHAAATPHVTSARTTDDLHRLPRGRAPRLSDVGAGQELNKRCRKPLTWGGRADPRRGREPLLSAVPARDTEEPPPSDAVTARRDPREGRGERRRMWEQSGAPGSEPGRRDRGWHARCAPRLRPRDGGPQTGWLQRQKCISSQFWGQRAGSFWGLCPWPKDSCHPVPSLCPHMAVPLCVCVCPDRFF